jgi:hypothetical protein
MWSNLVKRAQTTIVFGCYDVFNLNEVWIFFSGIGASQSLSWLAPKSKQEHYNGNKKISGNFRNGQKK